MRVAGGGGRGLFNRQTGYDHKFVRADRVKREMRIK